jgi:transposase
MTPKKQSSEIVRLRQQLARAQAETEIARANQHVLKAAIESLGKAHALLEELSESADSDQKPAESKKPQSSISSPTD